MPEYFAALTIVLLMGMVLTRVRLMKRQGIQAIKFGQTDKKDFLIPPFAFFYFYLVFAHALHWPSPVSQELFHSDAVQWIGVTFCAGGLAFFAWSLVSFGRSFRVGIDTDKPGGLVTNGAFAFSRNPIYVAFVVVLIGQFLVFPHLIFLIYLGAAVWLFNRQVLLEEEFMKAHYRQEYADYCKRVRRYL